jgi:excisionase family DNA binding protein
VRLTGFTATRQHLHYKEVLLMAVPQLFTIDEVATITHAPRSTVLYWIYSGRLATLKVGRRRLVQEVDLQRFLGISTPATIQGHRGQR